MTLKILTPLVLVCCLLTGCAVNDPASILGACLTEVGEGGPAGTDLECDLGRRTYIVLLPRDAPVSELKPLGVPDAVLSVLPGSSPDPSACVVATKEGGLPTPANLAAGGDGLTAVCVTSHVEIDRLAAFEAAAIRVHVQREPGQKARATSVKAIRR